VGVDSLSEAGLPDGFFSDQKFQFGDIWENLDMLFYILVIWNILLRLGIFYGHLVILWSFGILFPRFGTFTEKNLANLLGERSVVHIR
jgi:hypothetical protein